MSSGATTKKKSKSKSKGASQRDNPKPKLLESVQATTSGHQSVSHNQGMHKPAKNVGQISSNVMAALPELSKKLGYQF